METRTDLAVRKGRKPLWKWRKLYATRVRKSVSQAEVGKIIGVAGATIGEWERCTHAPLLCYWKDLAHFLDCTIEDLAAEIATEFKRMPPTMRRTRKKSNSNITL